MKYAGLIAKLSLFLHLTNSVVLSHPLGETESVRKKHTRVTNNTVQNLTNEEKADALRALGYKVRQLKGQRLVVLEGDVAYPPQQLLSRAKGHGRISGFSAIEQLWKDSTGNAELWYYFDNETNPDQQLFEAAVKTWADNTCIKLTKLPSGSCSQTLDHGAVCVGNFTDCWSYIGNQYEPGEPPQPVSVEPDECGVVAAAHEMGHALGLQHQQMRSDRDQYIHVKYENTEVPVLGDINEDEIELQDLWGQAGKCIESQLVDLPAPYDFMSLMHYGTADFADEDARPVYITKDVHHQYMLDYHRDAGLMQTHYDLYTVNTVYGCDKVWAASCVASGEYPPKCKHHGFIGKDCKCRCPKGFTGHLCETKSGPLFPLMAKARTMIEVNSSRTIDLREVGMMPEKLDGVRDSFVYTQFFTVIANGVDNDTQVSVSLHPNVMNIPYLNNNSDLIMDEIKFDCYLFFLMWGSAKNGNTRTECFTTIGRNESDGPILRSRSNHLDMMVKSNFGYALQSPMATIQLLAMTMGVVFAARPDAVLQLRQTQHELHEPEPPGESAPPSPSEAASSGVLTLYARLLSPGDKMVVCFGSIIIVLLLLLLCFSAANVVRDRSPPEARFATSQ